MQTTFDESACTHSRPKSTSRSGDEQVLDVQVRMVVHTASHMDFAWVALKSPTAVRISHIGNNSLNPTRPSLLTCGTLNYTLPVMPDARIRARGLAQKGWHVANKLAYGQTIALCSSTRELLGNQTTFSLAYSSKI